MNAPTAFAVGWCGASGIVYGRRLVEALLACGHDVHLVASAAAFRVLRYEEQLPLERVDDLRSMFATEAGQGSLHLHDLAAVEAAPASGSAGIAATILCPCSMGTLARVVHGYSTNLLERMADVAIKEGRRLLVVPRETPLSVLHLENMLKLARLGGVVLPAMPGFYHRPQTVYEMVDFVVGKILDRLGVESPLIRRWRTPPQVGADQDD